MTTNEIYNIVMNNLKHNTLVDEPNEECDTCIILNALERIIDAEG